MTASRTPALRRRGFEDATTQEFDAAEEVCRFAVPLLVPAPARRLLSPRNTPGTNDKSLVGAVVKIRGYEDVFSMPIPVDPADVLVDAWGTFDSLPYIAAHLAAAQADEELVSSTLGVTEEDAQDAYQRLTNTKSWPAFRIPLRSGDFLACVYSNLDDSESIDFLVEFKDTSPAIVLASIGENFGPGISWAELRRAVYENSLPSPVSPDVAFLLFLPMLQDTSAEDEAINATTEALARIGGNESSRDLAADISESLSEIWGPTQWNLVDNDRLVCNVGDAPRSATRSERQTQARVTQALA